MKLSEVAIQTCQILGVPQFVEMIDVVISHKMQTSLATASMKRNGDKREYILKINERLWIRASDEEKRNTLIHEICHLVEFYNYDKIQRTRAGHGPVWESYMRKCGLNPYCERFHNVYCHDLKRAQHKWDASCLCGKHKISTTKARRIMENRQQYICRRCGSRVTIDEQCGNGG